MCSGLDLCAQPAVVPSQPDHSANTGHRNAPFLSAEEIKTLHYLLQRANRLQWLRSSSIAIFVTVHWSNVWCGQEGWDTRPSWLCSGTTSRVWHEIPRQRGSPSARSLDDFHYFVDTTAGTETSKMRSRFKLHNSFEMQYFQRLLLIWGVQCKVWQGQGVTVKSRNTLFTWVCLWHISLGKPKSVCGKQDPLLSPIVIA